MISILPSPRTLIETLRLGLFSCLVIAPTTARAVDVIEDFPGVDVDTAVWKSVGAKTVTIAGGTLTWDGGANWGSGDLSTLQKFFLPAAGETTTIKWTLGPGEIITVNPDSAAGDSIRYQFGIQSANETAERTELWVNTTGGLFYDIPNITNDNTTSVDGAIWSANDTKTASSVGTWIAGGAISDWNWQTENHVITLEMTDTGYTWFNNGVDLIGSSTWDIDGIDSEFSNGYRVFALGMNVSQGRGTVSIEKIEILNAGVASELLRNFAATPGTVFSGQPLNISWDVDPDATAISIDQGIGDVTAITSAGSGQIQIISADASAPTTVEYTLTVTKGAETETRSLQVNVEPVPEPSFLDFFDHFDGAAVNAANWQTRGSKTFSVADSLLDWNDDAPDWGHGEVTSMEIFPMPPAGRTSVITWTLGTASVTSQAADGNAIRPMMGLVSAFEREPWSLAHWQNTAGGIWLDVTSMTDTRTDGVSGSLIYTDDTKQFNTNGSALTAFDVPDWNWQTETHEFSVAITDTAFTWYSGTVELGSANWADCGIDTEFSKGFRLMMLGSNVSNGRGSVSIDSIEVQNAAASAGPFEITAISYDSTADSVSFTWNSEREERYLLDFWDGTIWQELEDGIESGGIETSYTWENVGTDEQIYRIRKE